MISEKTLGSCFHGPLLHYSNLHAKSDRALYKIWHIAAKLSHETNLAITKLSLFLIHNTIDLGLSMFINATTRQHISIYSTGPYTDICLLVHPTSGKVGVQKIFSVNPLLYYTPHLKICGAAPGFMCVTLMSGDDVPHGPHLCVRTR